MVECRDRSRVKQQLAERLGNYFAQVPGASPEEFLLEAVRKEIAFRESILNGGRPWGASANSDATHRTPAFQPPPAETLPSEAIHGWLCRRLARLPRARRSRRSGWFW